VGRRARVHAFVAESKLRAIAEEPARRYDRDHPSDPSDLFYLGERPNRGRRRGIDYGDWRLVVRLGMTKKCPACGGAISWNTDEQGRTYGRCQQGGCQRRGTIDELLQSGPRVSPVLFAVKSAARRVSLGLLPRRSLAITNATRRRAQLDPVLAAALRDLEVIVSARAHVLGRHDPAALDANEIPLTIDFLRYLPGRRRISAATARARIRTLVDADVTANLNAGTRFPVFRLVRVWNSRRAATRSVAGGRNLLSLQWGGGLRPEQRLIVPRFAADTAARLAVHARAGP
jgi:hypothetical protein